MQNEKIWFRASGVGALLSQPVTKRDREAGILSATAKAFVRETYLSRKYGIQKILNTDPILKGILQEDKSIEMLSRKDRWPHEKNQEFKKNDWYGGTPDIVTDKEIIDVKTSFSPDTFLQATDQSFSGKTGLPIPDLYYTQLQVYMDLFNKQTSRLVYVLENNPDYQIEKAEKALWFRFADIYGGDFEENMETALEHQKQLQQIHANMIFDQIPESNRIKEYRVDFDHEFINDLREKVENAAKFYETINF